MTKNQELQILDTAIAALGRDSYLGPWLAEVRAEVVSLISSDILPESVTIASAVERGNQLIARAKSDADEIRSRTDSYRNRVIDEIAGLRSAAHKALADAMGKLSRMV